MAAGPHGESGKVVVSHAEEEPEHTQELALSQNQSLVAWTVMELQLNQESVEKKNAP